MHAGLKGPIVDFSMKAYIRGDRRQESLLIGLSQEKIALIEPDNAALAVSDIATRITTTAKEVTNEDILNLKNAGLIFFNGNTHFLTQSQFDDVFKFTNEKREQYNHLTGATTFCFSPSFIGTARHLDYNFYKSFNGHPKYSLSFNNRQFDYSIDWKGLTAIDTTKCVLSVFDRELKKNVFTIEFDDYIQNCFCSDNLIFVECMKKVIYNFGYSASTESCDNHRIEIYDVESQKLLTLLPLAFSENTNDAKVAKPRCELAYVDNEKIYLRILENGTVVGLNYYSSGATLPLNSIFVNDSVLHQRSFLTILKEYGANLFAFFLSFYYLNSYVFTNQKHDLLFKLIVKE